MKNHLPRSLTLYCTYSLELCRSEQGEGEFSFAWIFGQSFSCTWHEGFSPFSKSFHAKSNAIFDQITSHVLSQPYFVSPSYDALKSLPCQLIAELVLNLAEPITANNFAVTGLETQRQLANEQK